jgi:hypothetical protein
MSRWKVLAAVASLAAAPVMSGCAAKAQAVLPEPTGLTMPPAPARTVVPATPEPAASTTATETAAPPPATTPPSSTARPTRDTGGTRPTPPAAPPATPPVTTTPPAPTPLEATSNAGELEQRARALKDTAEKALDRIDVRTLGADGRAQYDTARRFIKQADDALRVKNVVYAWQLADKANTIATLLK